jgi:hypothetical protein
LGAGVLSVAPANAGAGDDKIVPNLGTVQGAASLTATVTGVIGGQVGFDFGPTTTGEHFITTDGKSTIVSADATGNNKPATVNGVSFADGAKWTPSATTNDATVKLTSATVGTSVVTIAKIAATTGVRSTVATLTITWASGTNTNLASLSAVFLAHNGTCNYAATATKTSISYNSGNGALLCIKATNAAGTAYTQNAPTIAVIGNGITSLTSGKTAVDAPSMGTDGVVDVLVNPNGLSGKATYTITASATNADGLTTSTQSLTATLNVYGAFTTITLANVKASILHSGGQASPISAVATDKDGFATPLDWSTVTETVWVESDKGTTAVSADAPDNASASAAAGVNNGVDEATGKSDDLGTITVTPTSSKYEKLTIWVSGKNALGATVTSNKVVVFVSTATVKSLVLDATASATGGMTYKVQALSDPAVTGTAYPVVDGETVTLGASAGILTANSVATDKTGFASTTLYPPALGSTVTLYATTGSGATLVSGSKAIANVITSEISSLTTLVNSLIAKINALNKLVIKIQKKVRA